MDHVTSVRLGDGRIKVCHVHKGEIVAEFTCANEFVARIAVLAENFVDMQFAVNAMNHYVYHGGKHKSEVGS